MECEECGSDEWELIVTSLTNRDDEWFDLYQCKKCKRVVCATWSTFCSNDKV